MLQQIIFGLLITQFTSNLLTFGIWQYLVHSTFCAGSGWILTKTIIKWFSYDPPLPPPPSRVQHSQHRAQSNILNQSSPDLNTLFGSEASNTGESMRVLISPVPARQRLFQRIIKSNESLCHCNVIVFQSCPHISDWLAGVLQIKCIFGPRATEPTPAVR